MELKLQNPTQVKIADLFWVAQTEEEVNVILKVFGHDAQVVYNMMIAASYDQVDNTPDADRVIQQFRLTR
jgi:hypothetical protein